MAADSLDRLFVAYLKCDLPLGYPLDSPLLPTPSTPLKERHRKELLYHQSNFLQYSERLRFSHPWISYLGSLKHQAVMGMVPATTLQFLDVSDQKHFKEDQQKWTALQKEARAAIDEATAYYCGRLVLLQSEASLLDAAEKITRSAIDSGFTSLEPLPPKPIDRTPGWLSWFGSILPTPKARTATRELKAALKAWHLQETYHRLCGQAFQQATALPAAIRNDGLSNLEGCLNTMGALRSERELLEANYIAPYLG